jgi:hypothetical protein
MGSIIHTVWGNSSNVEKPMRSMCVLMFLIIKEKYMIYRFLIYNKMLLRYAQKALTALGKVPHTENQKIVLHLYH